MLNIKSKYKQQKVFFGIVVVVALLSQFPDANKSIMTPITYIAWGLAAVFVIYGEKIFVLTNYMKLFIITYGGCIEWEKHSDFHICKVSTNVSNDILYIFLYRL